MSSLLRYEVDLILFLRDSPLSQKPKALPPLDEWMGPRGDRARLDKTPTERTKFDNSALDPTRRTSNRNNDDGIGHFRSGQRLGTDGNERFSHNRAHTDGDNERPRFKRREEQESDGWNMVRTTKGFTTDGNDRFTGRMGGSDRFSERRPRDTDREHSNRDEDAEGRRGTVTANPKAKGDWFRNNGSLPEPSSSRPSERLEKVKTSKSWRERDENIEESSSGNHRNYERKWGRDGQNNKPSRSGARSNDDLPAWMGDDTSSAPKTVEDLAKFMEDMKKRDREAQGGDQQSGAQNQTSSPRNSLPPKKLDLGPDKFLGAATTDGGEASKAPAGKSRFMSFLVQDATQQGPLTAPIPGHAPIPHMPATQPLPGLGQPRTTTSPGPGSQADAAGFQAMLAKLKMTTQSTPPYEGAMPPPPQQPSQTPTPQQMMPHAPPPGLPIPDNTRIRNDSGPNNGPAATLQAEMFRQYGGRDPSMPPPQAMHDMMLPQQQMMPNMPLPQMQLLQTIVTHRQQQQSAQGNRMESGSSAQTNGSEYLMNLMRQGSESQDPQQHQQHQQHQQSQQPPIPPPQQQSAPPMLHQQPAKPAMQQMPQMPAGEQEFLMQQRFQQLAVQQQQQARSMPPMPRGGMRPPGYMEDFHPDGSEPRQGLPNQLLSRGPSLDQMPGGPAGNPPWMGSGPIPTHPTQQRGMMPPPGLANGGGPVPNRTGPPPGMYGPGNYPMPGFPPDGMPPAGMGMPGSGMPPGISGGMPGCVPSAMPGAMPGAGHRMIPPPGMNGMNMFPGNGPPPMNYFNPGMQFQGPPGGPDGLMGPGGPYGPNPNGPGGPYDARGMPMSGPQRGAFPRQ